jgi:hypothetical protein
LGEKMPDRNPSKSKINVNLEIGETKTLVNNIHKYTKMF